MGFSAFPTTAMVPPVQRLAASLMPIPSAPSLGLSQSCKSAGVSSGTAWTTARRAASPSSLAASGNAIISNTTPPTAPRRAS
eukprot:6207527-Pleurochrysis_carterae.AAC.3